MDPQPTEEHILGRDLVILWYQKLSDGVKPHLSGHDLDQLAGGIGHLLTLRTADLREQLAGWDREMTGAAPNGRA